MTFTFAPLQHPTPTLEGEEFLWPLLMKELALIGSVLTIHALLQDLRIWLSGGDAGGCTSGLAS